MSDRAAFLTAVRDEPDEDTHRLVYADWLDESGQPEHAEFVRLQVAGAGKPGVCWNVTRRGHFMRFESMLGLCPWRNPDVLAAVRADPGYVQTTNSTAAVLWRRGWVEGVLCSGVSLGGVLPSLRWHPVREARLTNTLTPKTIRGVWPDCGREENRGDYRALLDLRSGRCNALRILLRRVWPHLTHAGYDFRRPGVATSPFDVARVRSEEA